MANRYWIGGTGSWSEIAHWSASSGGAGNQTVPTSSDDVFIDSNSGFGGEGTITLDVVAKFNDLTCSSGHTYTIDDTLTYFIVYGSLTLEAGLTLTYGQFNFRATTTGKTITTAGIPFYYVSLEGLGGGWTLQDDLVITGQFNQENGTFDTNDHNVTASSFYFCADTGYTPTVIMGSGTWEVTGNGDVFQIGEYNGEVVTITSETSTIKFTSFNGTGSFNVMGDAIGKTLNNVWFVGANGSASIKGSWTFNDFKVTNPPQTIEFNFLSTTTVSSFIVNGSIGDLITLQTPIQGQVTGLSFITGINYQVGDMLTIVGGNNDCVLEVAEIDGNGLPTNFSSVSNGSGYSVANGLTLSGGSGTLGTVNITSVTSGQFTLSKSSGIVGCDYLDISNSNATGGAVWYAGSHSADTTNNDGWIFEDAPTTTNHNNLLLLNVG